MLMQMKAVASLMLNDVPGFRIRDSSFWTLAYRQLVNARPSNGPQELYEKLLPYLNSRPLLSNVPAGLSKEVSPSSLGEELTSTLKEPTPNTTEKAFLYVETLYVCVLWEGRQEMGFCARAVSLL